MSPEKISHLQIVQNIIDRMNRNSFQLKGWCITIVSAFLALFAKTCQTRYLFISVLPTLLFGLLDTYYLQMENKLIGIYNDILSGSDKVKLFEIPLNDYSDRQYSFMTAFKSKSICGFYFPIIIVLSLIITIFKR